MLEFIAKYWLEFVFGIIALGMSAIAKYFHGLVKKGVNYDKEQKERTQDAKTAAAIDELREELKDQIDRNHEKDVERDQKIDKLLVGVQYILKKELLEEAARFMQPDHVITYDEFMEFTKAHAVYNGLDGNSEGDQAFEAVKEKYYKKSAQ